jgi:hypothetical protein
MLAEIFMLFLEHLIRTRRYADGAPRVVSSSLFVPMTKAPLPAPVERRIVSLTTTERDAA